MPVPPPGASGQMAVPGPLAFQCTNDVPCGTHHCNVQYGKCAFPCQTDTDCRDHNTCRAGLCVRPFVNKCGRCGLGLRVHEAGQRVARNVQSPGSP